MKKLEGRDMITHIIIARKVNEIIELMEKKGLINQEPNNNELLKKISGRA